MKDSSGYCSVHESYHCTCYTAEQEKAKSQLVLTCPVHGEYEVTPKQKTCPTCLTQAALYRQIEMDGLEGIRPENHELGDCLDEAKRTICGERQDVYGNPEDSFTLIANYWNAYLAAKDGMLSALDIAHMMILFKMARVQGQAPKRDNYVDLCGYAGIAADRLSK
jgi:hypothetical protein